MRGGVVRLDVAILEFEEFVFNLRKPPGIIDKWAKTPKYIRSFHRDKVKIFDKCIGKFANLWWFRLRILKWEVVLKNILEFADRRIFAYTYTNYSNFVLLQVDSISHISFILNNILVNIHTFPDDSTYASSLLEGWRTLRYSVGTPSNNAADIYSIWTALKYREYVYDLQGWRMISSFHFLRMCASLLFSGHPCSIWWFLDCPDDRLWESCPRKVSHCTPYNQISTTIYNHACHRSSQIQSIPLNFINIA